MIYDDKGREIINFGKYKGQVAIDVLRKDPGYYSWIEHGDFRATPNAPSCACIWRAKRNDKYRKLHQQP